MLVLVLHAALSGFKTSRALLVSQRWLFHCQVRSGSGCALLFSNLPDCHARRYVPGLRGASFRRRALRCEHIAILQSAASSGLPSAIWRECRSAPGVDFQDARMGALLENTDSESDAPFRPRMPLMANPPCSGGVHQEGQCAELANATE